jgi:hypothetical protein
VVGILCRPSLAIEADRDIQVMRLMASPERHIANLSSLPDDE